MSLFTNRIKQAGYIEQGGATALVVEAKNGFLALYQTHAKGSPLDVASFSVDSETGLLDTTNGLTEIPEIADCKILPETCSLFDAVKAEYLELSSKVLTLCTVCVGNGVTLDDMSGICSSCQSNYETITSIKSMV